MRYKVQTPDGTVVLVEAPEGATQDEVLDFVKRDYQPSTLKDVGKAIAYAPGKAITGLAGLPGDVRDLVAAGRKKLSSYLPDWVGQADTVASAIASPGLAALNAVAPTGGQLRQSAEQVTGPWYDPQTRAGKVADTATQAATTFGRSLFTQPRQALPIIAGITAGTEGAGAATNDNPVARFVGGLLGGGIPALAQGMRNRTGVVLKDAIGGKSERDIAEAIARQEMSQRQGLPLMGTESLDAGHQLASAVLAHPTANKAMEEFLRQRAARVGPAVQRDIIGQTGPMQAPAVNAARAQQAATDVIGNAEQARTAAVNPFYRAAEAETLPQQALRPVANEIQNMLFKAPLNSAQERAIGGWHKQLFPYQPEAPTLPKMGAAAKGGASRQVDPNTDDIITAIRKLGGITPADESIGSLAKHYQFSPDPRFGPVWRQSEFRGATGTTAGHSPDRIAELLHEKGYLQSRDGIGELMSKIEDAAMGTKTHYSLFYQPPSNDPLANAIDALTKQLASKSAPKQVAPAAPEMALPETNVGRLNEVYKNLGIARDLPAIGALPEQKMAAYSAGKVQDALGDVLKQGSPNIARGQEVYSQITKQRIEPLQSGPIGVIAGKAGYDAAEASPIPRIVNAIADPKVARPDTIRNVYAELNKVDRQAFPGIVQTHLENQLNAALEKIRSGPNPTAGAKFAQAIAGTPLEQANFNEMMRGVAIARGRDPERVIVGANNLLKTLELTGRTPGIGSPTASRGEINKELGKTLFGDTLSTISITPTRPLARRFDDWIQRGRYEKLAEALTSEKSVQLLVQMAKLSPRSLSAQYIAASLLGLDRALNESGR